MHIVVTDGDTVVGHGITLDFLKEFGEVTVYGLTPPEELAARIATADAVICNKSPMTAEVMAAAPRLKYVGLFATGYNNVDIAYAAAHGITVCNVPGYSTEAVAQHTFALLLQLTNQVGEYNRTVQEGDWVKSRTFSYFPLPLAELCGKTMGIVGYGAIGRRVGEIARAFGMQVLVCGRRPIGDAAVEQVPLEELLSRADVVSLHCPLNADSLNMLDEAAFARMKEGAYLINTARGPLVDEVALRAALDSGRLGGAAVDVLRQEPMAADCPLLGAPRCIFTPHIAWAGVETRRRLMAIVAENLRCFMAGQPQNTVM
ncbi:MAG: D-2-hydroxyacid dehydrogenase [Clostridia bacterium]|nr:D-2-hydroxyacid dehydrogenase [Clostridia bacterium]